MSSLSLTQRLIASMGAMLMALTGLVAITAPAGADDVVAAEIGTANDGLAAQTDPPATVRRSTVDSCALLSSPCQGAVVRSGPSRDYARVGVIGQGTSYAIECQVRGAAVRDSFGVSSDVWNRTTLANGETGWIPDTWGGRIGWLGTECPPGDPRDAAADSCLYGPDPCFGAILRDGPSRAFDRAGRLAQGEEYRIDCQTRGQRVQNSLGEGSNVWNRVVLENDRGAWVPDTWGGMAGWLDIQCGAAQPSTPVAEDSAATAEPAAAEAPTAEAPAAAEEAPVVQAIDQETATGNAGDEAAVVAEASLGVADSCLYFPARCTGATVRSGPGNSFARITRLAQGTEFVIDCQTNGQAIRNSLAESSSIWNRVTLDGGRGGWIADTWSGNVGWLDNQC